MLEKTVLQQLQEIFPMEVNREEADAGEKIRLRNDEQKVEIDFILDGHLEQGYGYKNFKAYNRDVYETSYISEYGYEEYKKQNHCNWPGDHGGRNIGKLHQYILGHHRRSALGKD